MGSRMGDIWRSGSWLSCPSASFLLGQRSEHLDRLFHSVRFDALYPSPTHPTRPPPTLPLFSWWLAHWVETMRKLWCETSGIASITCLRFKAAPRQASGEDAYSKCGSLLSTAQSSELGKGRVLDEAHLEKIKSIVSLSSP